MAPVHYPAKFGHFLPFDQILTSGNTEIYYIRQVCGETANEQTTNENELSANAMKSAPNKPTDRVSSGWMYARMASLFNHRNNRQNLNCERGEREGCCLLSTLIGQESSTIIMVRE